jgi:hypothetical protein
MLGISFDFKIGGVYYFGVFFRDSHADAIFRDALDIDVAFRGYDVGDT